MWKPNFLRLIWFSLSVNRRNQNSHAAQRLFQPRPIQQLNPTSAQTNATAKPYVYKPSYPQFLTHSFLPLAPGRLPPPFSSASLSRATTTSLSPPSDNVGPSLPERRRSSLSPHAKAVAQIPLPPCDGGSVAPYLPKRRLWCTSPSLRAATVVQLPSPQATAAAQLPPPPSDGFDLCRSMSILVRIMQSVNQIKIGRFLFLLGTDRET